MAPAAWPTIIAAYAAILSTALLVLRLLEYRRDRPRLRLSISPGMVMGSIPGAAGSDNIIQVTATNAGLRSIGVSSLNLELTNGRHIPLLEYLPTGASVRLPAVLQPQQQATMWLDAPSARERLHNDGARLEAILEHLADGSTQRQPVPGIWRTFGDS